MADFSQDASDHGSRGITDKVDAFGDERPPTPPPHRVHRRSLTELRLGLESGRSQYSRTLPLPKEPPSKLEITPAGRTRRRPSHRRNTTAIHGDHPIVTRLFPLPPPHQQVGVDADLTDLEDSEINTYNDGGPASSLSAAEEDDLAQLIEAKLLLQRASNFYSSNMAGTNNSFSNLDSPVASNNRGGASPTSSLAGGQSNGNGMGTPANYMAPLPVGHQQDLNYLYGQIQELSTLLKSNREKVTSLTKAAEEVARRASANGVHAEGDSSQENTQTQTRELELELAKANHIISLYKHEQTENTNLIAMYEDALGNATEGIRNYCLGIEERFLGQRRHYNNLLQQEKDEHLQSRLDRDHWHAQTLKVCEMIRTAHRLRTDEWGEEYTIIAALQTEVRSLRRCIGLDPEKPEEETGWSYLKDAPLNDTS